MPGEVGGTGVTGLIERLVCLDPTGTYALF
jgi:hypothetical protein